MAESIRNRVVVTGMGVLCAGGNDCASFLHALQNAIPGIAPLELVDRERLRTRFGAEVRDYDPLRHFDVKKIKPLDRFAQFALVAAREAVAMAGVQWTDELREQTAVLLGSTVGGQSSEDLAFADLYRDGKPNVPTLTIPRTMLSSAASHAGIEFGITGPTFAISSACSSASHAIGQAMQMIRSGSVRMALAGGSEAPFSLGILKAWDAMRILSQDTCRPFSRDRGGIILGEGAGVLLLESLESAQSRGAEVLAEITGFGMCADAYHITQPSVEGARRLLRLTLADAGVSADAVDAINAHGTGTAISDKVESEAIHSAFGSRAASIPVSATKSLHGHTLGAAGGIEAIASILSLRHRFVPATMNFTGEDPECLLDVVPNEPRAAAIGTVLSTSLAFGGQNAALLFRRWGS